VHIKACLLTGNIHPELGGKSRICLNLQLEVDYIQAKGYCTISLLAFMQKMMKNSRPGTSELKYWGMSPTSITICLQTREVHINRKAPGVYTYTGSSGKQEVTLELS